MNRVHAIKDAKASARPPSRRRGLVGQRRVRESEQTVRRSGVALLRWLARRDLPATFVARRLGVPRSTLLRWEAQWRADRLVAVPLGRPADRPENRSRNEVLGVLFLLGATATEETLRRIFPAISRAEIRELRRRYLRVTKRRYGRVIGALCWVKPGRVWAMDFTQPPTPVDGVYPTILVVRDLASGTQLLALPCPDLTAETTIAALRALFAEHGAPLVLKCDNGSAFIAEDTRAFLVEAGVVPLYSPPGFPQYNGSCEAGIGGLKTRAHHVATRNDRPGHWTCDDVEAARELGNETPRARGKIRSPAAAFARRKTVTPEERTCFLEVLEDERQRERAARGLLLPFAVPQSELDGIDRVAVSHTLVRTGLLLVRRRRIPQPDYASNRPNIS